MSFILLYPVTNLLLFDTESWSVIQPIVESTVHFRNYLAEEYCLNDVPVAEAFDLFESKYKVVLAIPEARLDLHPQLTELTSRMERLGVSLVVSSVKASDMVYGSRKLDLLACSLWLVSGAIIFNDQPMTENTATVLYKSGQRLQSSERQIAIQKTGWFHPTPHFGVIRDEFALSALLKGRLAPASGAASFQEFLLGLYRSCNSSKREWLKFQ